MAKTTRLFSRSMGRWLMALLLVMLSSLATRAAEAYACYTSSNTTLTFYYDTERSSRTGTTYDLNTGSQQTGWYVDETYSHVTQVVIDPSFVEARPTSTYMWFYGMENVHSITGLNYLNTENVTNMGAMFMGCSGFTSLDLSHFNTTMVTDMFHMFYECSNLTSLDVSSFNTAQVIDMRGMFRECGKLTSLDLSSFNTAMVEIMNQMFSGDTQLVTIYVGQGWSTESLNYSYEMFENCTSLVGGQGTTYDANHMDAEYAHIDGGTANPGYFTEKVPETEAYACYTPSNTTLTFYYDTQRSSRTGTTYDLNTGSFIPGWNNVHANVTKVVFDPSFANARPTSTYGWFYAMEKLQFITGMSYLNTSEVTNMSSMFFFCSALTSLDLSSFNTANVTDMSRMFYYCKKLTSLDLSSFNTAKVTDMCDMFRNCSSLSSLDLSSFNTANVTDMSDMFRGGSSLSSLDLSSFNTAKVTNMTNMFYNCTNLRTIYVGSGWSTAAVEYSLSMFSDCSSLVGGQGTTYDSSHVNAEYAHIDGGTSNPGYFSDKNANLEAYACYTPENTTLTFYYDKLRSSRTGTTYDLNTGENKPDWCTYDIDSKVKTVVFEPSFADFRPTTTAYWFADMFMATTITGIEYLNTSEVTNMRNMFEDCNSLTDLDVSHFNTANVTNMGYMFYYCNSLTSLDVSHFNTANVTDMGNMFDRCSSLTDLDVSHFNTANVTDMSGMFDRCSSLTDLDVSGFNTANVTNMAGMFSTCSSLTDLDVSHFNTANVTDMSSMFALCNQLSSLDVSHFNTANVTDMDGMFHSCSGLTDLDVSSFNTANVTNMRVMFYSCSDLVSLDLSSFNTSKVAEMMYMFGSCSALTTIYAGSDWSTAAVNRSDYMFKDCTHLVGSKGTTYSSSHVDASYAHIDGGLSNPGYLSEKTEAYACYTPSNTTLTFYYDGQRSSRTGTTYDLNTENNYPGWYSDGTNADVTKVTFDPSFADARPTSTYRWFYGMSNLTSITGLNLLNTSEVTMMFNMFYGCSSLTSLDLSNFNTAKVTNMGCMFQGCSALTSLDVSSFNTANVTVMSSMFLGCSGLTSLDLSNFNTAKVIMMDRMFYGCSAMTNVDLSSFNTSNVTEMQSMFSNCSALTSLDLSSFNTAKVTYMEYMFSGSSNLRTIYVSDSWSTAAVRSSTNMFQYCTSLVGGMGTTWKFANPKDKTYAHVDGGSSNPGYFTYKPAFIRGDVNNDGQVKISDVTALINYLLTHDATGINLQAADTTMNEEININDVTFLINYLLSGMW